MQQQFPEQAHAMPESFSGFESNPQRYPNQEQLISSAREALLHVSEARDRDSTESRYIDAIRADLQDIPQIELGRISDTEAIKTVSGIGNDIHSRRLQEINEDLKRGGHGLAS